MKKIGSFILVIAVVAAVSGCYRPEFDELDREIESLRNAHIATLAQQLQSVTNSLGSLADLNGDVALTVDGLEDASKALEARISEIATKIETIRTSLGDALTGGQEDLLSQLTAANAALETELSSIESSNSLLKEKYDALLADVASLQSYADGTFATKDWLSATFVTLNAQNALLSDIALLKNDINNLEIVTLKIQEQLLALIDQCAEDAREKCSADIAAQVSTLRDAFDEAMAAAALNLKEAFDTGLKNSIAENEEAIKTWVNAELTEKYYTVASADAQVEVFKALLGSVPAGYTLQGEVDALSASLKNAQVTLTSNYEEAISQAIEKNEGIIKEELAKSIAELTTEVINPLSEKVKKLEGDVSDLLTQFESLTERVNTLEKQVSAMSSTRDSLEAARTALGKYIDSLKTVLNAADVANKEAIEAMIDQLTARLYKATGGESSLEGQIASLEAFIGKVGQGETSIVDWVNTSMGAIDTQFSVLGTLEFFNTAIAGIDTVLIANESEIDRLGKRVQEILDKAEISVNGWIDAKLANYYSGAKIQDSLNAIKTVYENLFKEGDATLQQQLDALQDKVAKDTSALRKAYKAAIDSAITSNNGYVTSTIKSALDKADKDIADLWSSINDEKGVVKKIEKILSDVADLNEWLKSGGTLDVSVTNLKEFLQGTDYESLKALADTLKKQLDSLDLKYASLAEFNDLCNKVNDPDSGLFAQVEKIKKFAVDLEAAETMLETLNGCLADVNLSSDTTLVVAINAINANLDTLKNDIVKTGGLKDQLAAINTLIYGTGTSISTASEGSIFYKINDLNGKLATSAKAFTTITYVPEYADGTAGVEYQENGSYNVTFKFIVSPGYLAGIFASVLNSGGGSMRFIGTPTRATQYYDFSSVTYSSPDSCYLQVDAVVGSEYKKVIRQGASAVLSISTDAASNGEKYDFVSDFIPMSLKRLPRDGVTFTNKTPVAYITIDNVEDSTKRVVLATSNPLKTTTSSDVITYRSSDPTVASVDEDGDITYYKKGKTTITATVAATDLYAVAIDSCVLTVKDKYLRRNDIEPGYQYILYSALHLLKNNNSSSAGALDNGYNIESENQALTLTADESCSNLLWTASKHYEPADVNNHVGYSFNNTGWYLHSFGIKSGYVDSPIKVELHDDMKEYSKENCSSTIRHIYYGDSYDGDNQNKLVFYSPSQSKLYAVCYTVWSGDDWYNYFISNRLTTKTYIFVSPYKNKVDVNGVTINSKEKTTCFIDQSLTLSASVSPANAFNTVVKWSSSNPSVATIDSLSGVVTINGIGETTFTAKSEADETKSDSFTVNFTKKVNSITVSPSTYKDLGIGDTLQLSVSVAPSDAANKSVTWSSSDNAVATVDQNGLVTGVSAGDATITATAKDGSGVTGTCKLNVKASYQNINSISPTSITFSADGNKYYNGSEWKSVPASVTVNTDDDTKKWSVTSSSLTSSATYDSGKLKVAGPASAVTSWTISKPTGSVTIQGWGGGNTKTLSLEQNRPLTVTLDDGSTEKEVQVSTRQNFTFNIKSDCDYKVSEIGSGDLYKAKTSDVTNDAFTNKQNITIGFSYNLIGKDKSHTVTIENKEGDKYKIKASCRKSGGNKYIKVEISK